MPAETAKPNFSGFVSMADLKCGDGRTILKDAFADQDGMTVPLTFEHSRKMEDILGNVKLTNKPEGVWGDVYLNEEVPGAKRADSLVKHGDLKMFSIRAGDLLEKGLDVVKGKIKEVSLTLSGMNAGAQIHNYNEVLAHSGLDEEDLLLIVGGEIMHSDGAAPAETEEPPAEEDEAKKTGEVLATLSDEQAAAVNSVFTAAVEEAVTTALTEAAEQEAEEGAAAASETGAEAQHSDSNTEGTNMPRNRFDQEKQNLGPTRPEKELVHSDMVAILSAAKGTPGRLDDFNSQTATGSLREFVRGGQAKELIHADTYGIDNMEVMFPDAQNIMARPTWVDRRQDWVKVFMSGTGKTPFSRVKTMFADITADEARARGYIKGNQKVDEVFPVFKRTTGPAWIYKRQKLDRQDIIDIVDFDVVAWMKAEMRGKLDEEIARAGLLGDGRPVMIGGDLNPDKIQEPSADATSGDGIRSILNDNDLYSTTYNVPLSASPTDDEYYAMVDQVVTNREDYLGSGNLTCFMSYRLAAKMLTRRDEFKHRVYSNLDALAGEMDVQRITRVPSALMDEAGVAFIIVDLGDYNFGANKGGEVTLFDDFDINVNQYIYLMETYLSGALTLPYSAQVYKIVAATLTLVTPNRLLFTNPGTVEYVAQTGVVYKRTDTGATLAADIVLTEGQSVTVEAFPAGGYRFASNYDGVDSNDYEYGDPTG